MLVQIIQMLFALVGLAMFLFGAAELALVDNPFSAIGHGAELVAGAVLLGAMWIVDVVHFLGCRLEKLAREQAEREKAVLHALNFLAACREHQAVVPPPARAMTASPLPSAASAVRRGP